MNHIVFVIIANAYKFFKNTNPQQHHTSIKFLVVEHLFTVISQHHIHPRRRFWQAITTVIVSAEHHKQS